MRVKFLTKNKRKLISVFLCIIMTVSLCGCTMKYTEEQVNKDTETDTLTVDEETAKMQTSQTLDVHGETFKLICNYDTGKYDVNNWHVTDDKSINMEVYTKNLPDGYQVYIDHVHIDISLKSTKPQLNGLFQDSMDDTSHQIPTNGFYIDNETKYYNTFAIKGYNQQFYQMWGYLYGSYGSISSSNVRLTEQNLLDSNVYAEKLHVVYDLNIKGPDDTEFHTISVESATLIPVSQDAGTHSETKTLEF